MISQYRFTSRPASVYVFTTSRRANRAKKKRRHFVIGTEMLTDIKG